jgi:hypothetical protein
VLNGVEVADWSEGDDVPAKIESCQPDRGPRPLLSYFGLQNHSGSDTVYFKDVRVRSLSKLQ